jgi:hypothetical protein
MNFLNPEVVTKDTIQFDSNKYLGTVGNLVDMLIEFANDEATEVFHNNYGLEEMDDCHINIAHNFLSKASDLMAFARDEALTKDSIIFVDIGDDGDTVLAQTKIISE